MKISTEWKTLTRDQRRAWNVWAKSNKVLLSDGTLRYVSGRKAFTVILANRAIAGASATPTVVPSATTWLDGSLGITDAGPYTRNAGYVGFRAAQSIVAGTKWFVWATPPVTASETNPLRLLRYVTCLSLGAMNATDIVPTFGTAYEAVLGSWDGPGEDGAWPTQTFVYFRLHQYSGGQLSPGRILKGLIATEL